MKNVIESLKHMAFFIGGMQGIFLFLANLEGWRYNADRT